MKAVKNTAAGITVVDVDEPEVRDPSDGVIVHVRGSSICGSDLKMAGFGPLEFVLGHEFSGVLDDGTAVAVDPGNQCGVCVPCVSGLRHLCHDNPILGISADGGLAERVLVKPEALVRLPSGLPVEYGCLVEPLAVSVHGLETAGIRGGERVAVVVNDFGEAAIDESRPDGSVVVTLDVVNRDAFRTFVLELLDHAEVLDPPELRADLVDWLTAMTASGTKPGARTGAKS